MTSELLMQPSNENKRGGNSKIFHLYFLILTNTTFQKNIAHLYTNFNYVECTKMTYRLGECKVSENIPLIDGIARYNPAF